MILVNIGMNLGTNFTIVRRQIEFLNGLDIITGERKHVELNIKVLLGLSYLEEIHSIRMWRQLIVLKAVFRALVDWHAYQLFKLGLRVLAAFIFLYS